MKILVTGGFGYIGGRLVSYLKEKHPENEIIVAERVSCVVPQWAKKIIFVPLELLSEKSIKECVNRIKPECVIHLAALNEIDCVKDPGLADKVNRVGTELLVKNAFGCSVRKFIYFSTFHVYGKAAKEVITEEIKPEPVHPYAITHLEAEKTVLDGRYKSMEPLIFRLSNSYGYPMDKNINRWTLLVNDLCRQAVFNGEIVLTSSGKQKRDFIALSNAIEAVRYFLFDIPNKWGDGLYNLGSGNTVSVFDMASKIRDIYHKKYGKMAKLVLGDSCNESVINFLYSVDKLKRTGFNLKEDSLNEISKTMDICEKLK